MPITLEAIAYVSACRVAPADDDWGDTRATITLVESLDASALDGIEDYSHVEVLYLFHAVAAENIVAGARHPRNNPNWPKVGILAQRAKNRPNRIGSTICKLLHRSGRSLVVLELDAIDGTPILDIKPVMVEFLPRDAIRQPAWSTELMANYWRSTSGTSASTREHPSTCLEPPKFPHGG